LSFFFKNNRWQKKRKNIFLPKSKKIYRFSILKRKFFKISAKIWIFISTLLVLAIFLGIIFSANFFSIREISILRKDLRVNISEVQKKLKVFFGKNIFITSKEEIIKNLQNYFPEISNIEIEKIFPSKLRISITTFPIVAKWHCSKIEKKILETGEILENKKELTAFVSQAGILNFSDPEEIDPFLIFEKNKCPENFKNGEKIISSEKINNILLIKKNLEEMLGKKIIRAGFFRSAHEIHFFSEDEIEFWFDFSISYESQLQKLQNALKNIPNFLQNVKYLDLRVKNKIFSGKK